MTKTCDFADAVGRSNIAAAVGVNLKAVSNAVVRGAFPASWYVSCGRLAVQQGIECPPELFNMKINNPSNVDCVNKNQVGHAKSVPAEPMSDADADDYVRLGGAS